MAVKSLFQGDTGTTTEKTLYNDLIVESIQVNGMDVRYLPRTAGNLDMVYLEDTQTTFSSAVLIEMWLKSWDGFQGDGSFMSTLGVEIRNQVVFTVAITRFAEELGANTAHQLLRPREGDLIYYPFNAKLFEIKNVEKFSMHYPLGTLYTYEMKCELLEYSGQIINTGNSEIDAITSLSQLVNDWNITDEAGNSIMTEDGDYWMGDAYDPATLDPLDDAERIQTEADAVLDFDEYDIWTEHKY